MVDPETTTSSSGLIAVVDDDSSMRELLRRSLDRAGYAVTAARNGAEAIETVSREPVDLVLLDLGLPDFSGLEVLRQIREITDVPVIVVSGHAAEDVRLRCFEAGADDYVVKPCFPKEIIARVAAVLKRSPAEAAKLAFGDVEIDVNAREVRVGGRPIELTARELDLLIHLARHPKTALTRQDLLVAVWNSSTAWQDASTVTEHIRRLRIKLEEDPSAPRHLIAVRGHGYRFEP